MQTSEKSENLIPNWSLIADYVEACNCDYGCPCNFSGFPTGGFCRALVLYHIQKGSYGQCRMILTYEAYSETIEEKKTKDKQIEEMMRKQEQFEQLIQSLINSGQTEVSNK